jgi:hypothetical protein
VFLEAQTRVKHFSSFIPQHFSEIGKMASPFFWNQENGLPTTLPGLRPVTVTHEVKELALNKKIFNSLNKHKSKIFARILNSKRL